MATDTLVVPIEETAGYSCGPSNHSYGCGDPQAQFLAPIPTIHTPRRVDQTTAPQTATAAVMPDIDPSGKRPPPGQTPPAALPNVGAAS